MNEQKGFQSHGKDIDREILMSMDNDEDLLKACSINKYFFNEVCDDMFFKNRLMKTYPNTLKYKTLEEYKPLSWKQYFLQVVYYIALLKEDFQYKYTNGNFKTQLKIFKLSNNPGNRVKNLLLKSAEYGELELVKEALKRGANIHARDDWALKIASDKGHLEVVKFLLDNGLDVHVEDDAPLRWATNSGHLEVVKYLVEHGADFKAQDHHALKLANLHKYTDMDMLNYLKSLY